MAGLYHTKDDIAAEQVKDVLGAKTLQEVLMRSLESVQRLKELNVFKNVSVKLDTVKGSQGRAKGLEVTFYVRESGRLASTVAANAGTQSGDAVSVCVCVCVCA